MVLTAEAAAEFEADPVVIAFGDARDAYNEANNITMVVTRE
jgi:hypothetical protein